MSHSTRGSKDTAIRAAPSLSVIERDVTSPDVNGNGAANGASASVNSSKQQLELEILPSFVPQELTAAADISEAFLSPESSALLSLSVLEPATSPQRQEPEAEAAEERGNNSSSAEVTDDAGKAKEDESWLRLMTQAGYSKRMEAIGDQFFESDLRPVVLFDGVCNLCNKWVNFLLDYDPLGNLRFASLQGDSGKALLRRAGRDENDHSDIVLVAHNKAYFGSDAILQIFSRLKPPFPLLAAAGHITPHALHDFIYKTVSESRYTLFGKADACRLSGPDLSYRIRGLNKIPHGRKLLAVKATVADVDGIDADVTSAEITPGRDGLETTQPESASASENLEATTEDVLISDDESSSPSKDDNLADAYHILHHRITQPAGESAPAETSADEASSKTNESTRPDAGQQGSSELSGGDLGYGPELQAFDDVTEPDDGIAEDAEEADDLEEEDDLEEDYSVGMSELGNAKDDDDDDVEWEEDLDFLVKPDEEAVLEKDATSEAAGGLAEGGGLADGATAQVAVSDQVEQGGLAVAATDDINKGPEPQVFDDVNEPEANNADGTETATVRDGNKGGSNAEALEESKEETSSVSDNKEGGGIEEGLKDIVDIDAGITANPISMVLEEDIEAANKGAEEVPDVEGHRRVLWMLENALDTEMDA
ncbi:unnamed protein product [Closterium sp. Yama58-4]|nr:unnamed protein product [Closterium sp. Yama58-4]